jgi:hypothetical protein
MHILLSSNGTPFEGAKGGYPSQLKYLIRMFVESGHTVTMIIWSLCGVKHTGVLSFRDIVNHNILPNETRTHGLRRFWIGPKSLSYSDPMKSFHAS